MIFKKIKSFFNTYFIFWTSILATFVFILLSYLFEFNINDNLVNTIIALNFSLFGFSITAIAIINGFSDNHEYIKEVMIKRNYIKRVKIDVWIMLSFSIIALLVKIIFDKNNLTFSCSIPCLFGTCHCAYYVLFLSTHRNKQI